MAAYVLVDIDVHDPARYEAYKALAAPTVALYGGRYLTRGGPVDVLEGEWPTARFVILEFPDVARAKAWHASDEYRAARAIRQATATTKMIVAAGVENL